MSTSECQWLINIVGSADDDDEDDHALTHTAELSVLQNKKKTHWMPDGVKYGPGGLVAWEGGSGEVDLWVAKYKTRGHWHYGIPMRVKSASYTFNFG